MQRAPDAFDMWKWLALICLFAAPATAEAWRDDGPGIRCSRAAFGPQLCIRTAHFAYDVCQQIETSARRHFLDPHFFARLIWQESRFDPNALSPADARGIAQFIDSTARLRGLRDSYNPAESLEKSAQYLAFLKQEFGNEGMAAVAYNGGEQRAAGFLARTGGLAGETIDYVEIITGLSAETWRDAPPEGHDFRLSKTTGFQPACLDLAQNRRLTAFAAAKPRISPWGVQVGYGRSTARARASVARLTRSCKPLIDKGPLEFIKVRNRVQGRPGYLMARLGRDTKSEAVELCRALNRQGCICRVRRNR